ncbi:leucine-rich repeat domain-containing protein [Butyrivibrio sp. DSM 10294]|uniref:leucine-rich repeat protein n=1 Tax=Butyrivibrio sp. DSM 10294 TaxID=2972457 RepID=UPI00234FA6E4|nr:leucine-rich repeat protein [Butyrivibrio sp. DSM 10294]MDC7292351.1 leucine-rich repeat domain-containing protein [Butyrivibrio sp. DSM 10294]
MIPSTVTEIGDYAFYKIRTGKDLKKPVIPDSVTTLGKHCFEKSEIYSPIVLGDGIT